MCWELWGTTGGVSTLSGGRESGRPSDKHKSGTQSVAETRVSGMDTIQKWHIPKLLEIVMWSFGRVFTMLAVIGWVIFDKLVLRKYHNIMKKLNAKRRHPLAYSYNSMIQRCYNENNPQYKDYGGRGITVCDRWLENQEGAKGFWNFVEDMGEKTKGLTLDRINNSKGYSPENCKWSTRKEQQRNRRNSVFITYNGKTQCAKDWALETGINSTTLWRRYKLGLPLEIVMSTKNYRGRGF